MSTATSTVLPPSASIVPPLADVPESERDQARSAARSRVRQDSLPIGVFEFAARTTHRPTMPPRALVPRTEVGRARHGGVPVTWIDRDSATRGLVVHLHGGGYIRGESADTWDWLEDVRTRAGVAAAMVHYRMPPRWPFAAAYDDALDAVRGIAGSLSEYQAPWVLSGDGAGAGLALAVTQALRDREETLPGALVLTSPWVDLTGTDPLRGRQEGADPSLSSTMLSRCAEIYTAGAIAGDPRISPVHGSMEGLPPVHLTVGGDELLLGDALALRGRLLDAGVEVTYLEQPGAWNNYPLIWRGNTAQHARRTQISCVRRAVGLDH